MKKWIPLLFILVLMIAVYFSGALDYLTFDTIKNHRAGILSLIHKHPILTPLLFIALYIVVVALSLPGATILTVLGGFFFGTTKGMVYVLIGATIGATLIFLAARTALGDLLKKKAAPFLAKMKKGFHKNSWSYLLFLRLVPLFPFWLVNLAPAFFNVKTTTYLWTTFVGIIPGTYVYTQAGKGLGAIFDKGEKFSLDSVFNTHVQIALVVLALFALIPILVKRLRRDR